MLYVLARSRHDFNSWRVAVGLPTSVVQPIYTAEASRGLQLKYSDIVRLDGFALNVHVEEIAIALAPCGIRLDKVAVVGMPLR